MNILTIHKSKGLEFKEVFVTYLRECNFPKYMANMEEERRLFYVALTRAKDELHIIGSINRKSELIREIEDLLESDSSAEPPSKFSPTAYPPSKSKIKAKKENIGNADLQSHM